RCGRAGAGLVVFMPLAQNPLDSYYAVNPQQLLNAPVEQVAFNAQYPSLVRGHLQCACCESGLSIERVESLFGKTGGRVAQRLLESGELREFQARLWCGGYPHRGVSLRGDQQERLRLVETATGELVEELSLSSAYTEAHPEALYLCLDGTQAEAFYRVTALDPTTKTARLERLPQDPQYRTQASQQIEIEVLEPLAPFQVHPTPIPEGRLRLTLGWGRITTLVTGYQVEESRRQPACANTRCARYRQPVLSATCPVCHQPPQELNLRTTVETVAFAEPYRRAFEAPLLSLELNPPLQQAVDQYAQILWDQRRAQGEEEPWSGQSAWAAMHTCEHLLTQAVPLLVISGNQDIGGATFDCHPQRLGTTTFFYDTSPGGTGVAEALFDRFGEFVQKAVDLADHCACAAGCPTCLYRYGCAYGNQGLVKALGLYLCSLLVGSNGGGAQI
ncbi:Zn-binding domain-containing protein, partial [Candidatus Cyanaurora vandensis]